MGNLLAYSGIVTKIRGMEAKLLTETQFEKCAGSRYLSDPEHGVPGDSGDVGTDSGTPGKYREAFDCIPIPGLYPDLSVCHTGTEKVFEIVPETL